MEFLIETPLGRHFDRKNRLSCEVRAVKITYLGSGKDFGDMIGLREAESPTAFRAWLGNEIVDLVADFCRKIHEASTRHCDCSDDCG